MEPRSTERPIRSALVRALKGRWGELALTLVTALVTAWLHFVSLLPRMAEGARWPWQVVRQTLFPRGVAESYGGGVDLDGTIWTFYQVARMLRGEVGTFQPGLFAPFGWDQGKAQGMAWLDALTAWPLVEGMGIGRFYNLYLLLMLAGGHWACTALCRSAGAPLPVALGLSTVALTNPFFQAELGQGRPTQVHIIFLALFLRHAWRLLADDARPVRDGLLAGAMLAAAGYVYWFGAIAVGLTGAVGVLLALAFDRARWRKAIPGGAVLVVSAVALAVLPTWRLAGKLFFGDASELIPELGQRGAAVFDLGLVEIPILSWKYNLWSWGELVTAVKRSGLTTPMLAAGLLALIVPLGWRRTLPWALTAWAAVSFPLGHGVMYAGTVYPTAFGLAALVVPPLVRCYVTERTMVAPLLALLLAGSLAVGALWRASERLPIARTGAAWALGVGLFLAGARTIEPTMFTTTRFEPNPAFQAIAQQAPGGIIDVPLVESGMSYVQQVFHGQPVLGGPGINGPNTRPKGHAEYCASNTYLVALETLAASDGPVPPWALADLQRLWLDGFRTVIVHTTMSASPAVRYTELLGQDVIYVGPRAVVFRLPDPSLLE